MSAVTGPCWIPDMPEDVYHADPCPEPSLSSTMAKTILQPGGPARLRYQRTSGVKETKHAFDYGSAAHAKVLGRGAGVAIYPAEFLTAGGNVSTARRVTGEDRTLQDDIRQWEADQRAAGLTLLTPKEATQIDDMVEALLEHQFAADLLTSAQGVPELSMFSIDEHTGRWLRGRLDLHLDDLLAVDYKTSTKPVSPNRWERISWEYGYHVQAAHYRRIATQVQVLQPDAEMWFIAQETRPPYLVGVYQLDSDLLDIGAAAVERAITLWDRCLATGEWPGLPQTVQTIGAHRWATRLPEEEE